MLTSLSAFVLLQAKPPPISIFHALGTIQWKPYKYESKIKTHETLWCQRKWVIASQVWTWQEATETLRNAFLERFFWEVYKHGRKREGESKLSCCLDLPCVWRVDFLLPFVSRECYVSGVYYYNMVTTITCKDVQGVCFQAYCYVQNYDNKYLTI